MYRLTFFVQGNPEETRMFENLEDALKKFEAWTNEATDDMRMVDEDDPERVVIQLEETKLLLNIRI